MVESLRNIFAVPDLRKRVLFTLALLAVYRVGNHEIKPGELGLIPKSVWEDPEQHEALNKIWKLKS